MDHPSCRNSSWPWRRNISSTSPSSLYHCTLSASAPAPRFTKIVTNLHEPGSRLFRIDEDRAADWSTLPVPEQEKLHQLLSVQLDDDLAVDGAAMNHKAANTNDKVQRLTQRLNAALEDLLSKDVMLKQHAKVAEDAVAGWEKAQAEASALKKDVELCLQQKAAVECRVVQLEDALKECAKQMRLAREVEQQQAREWEVAMAALESRAMEAEAQSTAMAKSLQERSIAIAECRESRALAEKEATSNQAKAESLEMAMAGLRCELRVQSKALEIANKEKEEWSRAAEAARKQSAESAKKVAKLEADCQRLRALVKKRLPGPADFAKMKMEVLANDSASSSTHSNCGDHRQPAGAAGCNKRMRVRSSLAIGVHSQKIVGALVDNEDPSSSSKLESLDVNMGVVMSKLLALEQESRTVKELLASQNSSAAAPPVECIVSMAAAADQGGATVKCGDLAHSPASSGYQKSNNILLNRFLLESSTSDVAHNLSSQHLMGHKSENKNDTGGSCSESMAYAAAMSVVNCKLSSAAVSDVLQMQAIDFTVEPRKQGDNCNDSEKLLSMVTSENIKQPQVPAYADAVVDDVREQQKVVQENEDQHVSKAPAISYLNHFHAQLQSANRMCKEAMSKLASAHALILLHLQQGAAVTGAADAEHGRRSEAVLAVPDGSATLLLVREALNMMSCVNNMLDETRMAAGVATEAAAGSCIRVDSYELELLGQQLRDKDAELSQARAELADAKVIIGGFEMRLMGLMRRLYDQEQRYLNESMKQRRGELHIDLASLQKQQPWQFGTEEEEGEPTAGGGGTTAVQSICPVDLKCESLKQSQLLEFRRAASCGDRVQRSQAVDTAKDRLVDCQRSILLLEKQLSALSTTAQYYSTPPPSTVDDDQSSPEGSGSAASTNTTGVERHGVLPASGAGAGSLTGSCSSRFQFTAADGSCRSDHHQRPTGPSISSTLIKQTGTKSSTIASMIDEPKMYDGQGEATAAPSCYGSGGDVGTIIKQVCTAVGGSRRPQDSDRLKQELHYSNNNNNSIGSNSCSSFHAQAESADSLSSSTRSTHVVESSSCGLNILGSHHRRMGSTSSEGVKYSVAEHMRMQEEYNVETCSLYSARSSPSVSPSRDACFVGIKRQPYHANPVVRTSLKMSMERAATAASDRTSSGATKSRGTHSSSFSRFFAKARK